jgi:hypothetical protein
MIELINVEKGAYSMAIDVDVFLADCKHSESLINCHQTCIRAQYNVRVSVFFMPERRQMKYSITPSL